MAKKRTITYADAGVNIDEANRATSKIKGYARGTFDANVLSGIGAFGAAYDVKGVGLKHPVLVSSADGVGTKLMVAFAMDKHDTVGQDLVNHCVNDIAVQGARPLYFLDYFATGKLRAGVAAQVVKGLSKACCENSCSLIGGETAEMPGMYAAGEYDLAGFIVGAAEKKELISPENVRQGDVLLGVPSTGLHTNGYSLARKLFLEVAGYGLDREVKALRTTPGRELLKIHRSYLKPLRALMAQKLLRGAAHITGGGITDNTPRMLPTGLAARIRRDAWPKLRVFDHLCEIGGLDAAEAYRTFNMGLGMIVAVPGRATGQALRVLASLKEPVYEVGVVVKGKRRVVYE
jgi:phosphoribosylformylglycinamidine cyclo-ligase